MAAPAFDLMPFVYELHRQASFGRRAADELDAIVPAAATDLDYMYPIQNLLVSAGIASHVLWPVQKFDARGVTLRNLVGVQPTSPLADRRLRNDFEHIDERIEEWRQKDGRMHIDSNIGPIGKFQNLSQTSVSTFREYDPVTGIASFWGQKYDLGGIANAIRQLHTAVGPHLPMGYSQRF